MKRTRTVSSVSKPQKKSRDGATKAAAAKVKKEEVVEEKRAPPAATVEAAAPAVAAEEEEVEVQCLWDVAGECGWWWGVEEDVLFGWFPFEEEDFLFSENRGSGGAFWEDYHDIWQLQHIHEIPSSSANNS
ncbi:hypothetical protein J5N97_027855 [Dioscorea zingiberensis]|uniref:Uncharacterized protein n=1 Tax=Dioscorea zingiberensis TaxID=325984 RepID=A0A9D5H4A2_9LILI|nr:hypothetical protein J5N97_027855 [Dioscorea zingiberensis]